MEILLLSFLILLVVILLYLSYRLLKWVVAKKIRAKTALYTSALVVLCFAGHHLFFKKMHFLQSQVYPNLYLVKYPDKNNAIVEGAIREKIKQHLKTQHKTGKNLAYTNENGIYFYEYHKAFPLSVFQDAGTAYFLENEEDLGGFVSEELGMYIKYRLAEFHYDPCKPDIDLLCGEINYFNEGEFKASDSLSNLISYHKPDRPNTPEENSIKPDTMAPIHGALDAEALNTFYPTVLSENGEMGNIYAEPVDLPNKHGAFVSLLRETKGSQKTFLCTHSKSLDFIDAFYVGKTSDFDNGKSQTIEYKTMEDSTLVFDKVVWGIVEGQQEETIDTLAHEVISFQVNQKGALVYSISKSPTHYALQVYISDADPNGTILRDAPNGNITQTLGPNDDYMLSIVKGVSGWFKILKVENVNNGEVKTAIGIPWIHSSAIGMRTDWDTPILATPNTGEQIGTVPPDQSLKIIDLERDWVKIQYQGNTGWVDSKLLCGNPVTSCS